MKTIQYAEGKHDVYYNGFRIGHITGAKDVWLAEYQGKDIGYSRTKSAAIKAIAAEHRSNAHD